MEAHGESGDYVAEEGPGLGSGSPLADWQQAILALQQAAALTLNTGRAPGEPGQDRSCISQTPLRQP